MEILGDGVVFQNTFQRGIQRYFYELFERVGVTEQVRVFLTAPAQCEVPKQIEITVYPGLMPRERFDLAGRLLRRTRIRRLVKSFRSADIFHSTYFTRGPGHGIPEVVTVHDLVLEQFKDEYDSGWRRQVRRHLSRYRSCILAASRIIAISHATARDLKKWLPEVTDKIRVVHHGSEHLAKYSRASEKIQSPERNVLYVGQRSHYKNFSMFLEAMVHPSWPKGMRGVIVGSELEAGEKDQIARMGLTDKLDARGYVSDTELSQLYARTTCFVFPSLGEGFGFPLLEAQCRGTAVACSDIDIFHEIAEDGAIYFDPRSAGSIAEAVARSQDLRVREELIQAGFKNYQRFSWDRCAEQTLQVYREAVSAGRGTSCT